MISGIFENCVGSNDVEMSLKYWAEFGYQEVNKGQLEAAQAKLLYGHASNLTSLRLQNGNSSKHGLVRVMWWSEPRNEGLGSTLPMVVGSRWFASLTKDIYASLMLLLMMHLTEETGYTLNQSVLSKASAIKERACITALSECEKCLSLVPRRDKRFSSDTTIIALVTAQLIRVPHYR
jgi:hypothetical protein